MSRNRFSSYFSTVGVALYSGTRCSATPHIIPASQVLLKTTTAGFSQRFPERVRVEQLLLPYEISRNWNASLLRLRFYLNCYGYFLKYENDSRRYDSTFIFDWCDFAQGQAEHCQERDRPAQEQIQHLHLGSRSSGQQEHRGYRHCNSQQRGTVHRPPVRCDS